MKIVKSILLSFIISGLTWVAFAQLAYLERGYFAVGGEAFITVAVFMLVLWKTLPNDYDEEEEK